MINEPQTLTIDAPVNTLTKDAAASVLGYESNAERVALCNKTSTEICTGLSFAIGKTYVALVKFSLANECNLALRVVEVLDCDTESKGFLADLQAKAQSPGIRAELADDLQWYDKSLIESLTLPEA